MGIYWFERNDELVLERFRDGEFDNVEGAAAVFETDFLSYIQEQGILAALAGTYPTPREREQVPVWLYLASNLSMRLHGSHAYHAFPSVIRCGGRIRSGGDALGPMGARKLLDPDTGEERRLVEGFNRKNVYDRETPCDPDFLRKLAKDTEAEALERWFDVEVAREM